MAKITKTHKSSITGITTAYVSQLTKMGWVTKLVCLFYIYSYVGGGKSYDLKEYRAHHRLLACHKFGKFHGTTC